MSAEARCGADRRSTANPVSTRPARRESPSVLVRGAASERLRPASVSMGTKWITTPPVANATQNTGSESRIRMRTSTRAGSLGPSGAGRGSAGPDRGSNISISGRQSDSAKPIAQYPARHPNFAMIGASSTGARAPVTPVPTSASPNALPRRRLNRWTTTRDRVTGAHPAPRMAMAPMIPQYIVISGPITESKK